MLVHYFFDMLLAQFARIGYTAKEYDSFRIAEGAEFSKRFSQSLFCEEENLTSYFVSG